MFASIVVPAFNASHTIIETLNSLLNQTYRNFEIIVVDDGSSDNTADLVKAIKSPKIKLVHQANRGLSGARNTGIHYASGEIVGFCDSDDLWHPEKLGKHIQHFQLDNTLGLSFSESELIDTEGKKLGIIQKGKCLNVTSKYIYLRNPIGNGSSPIFRAKALNEVAFFNSCDTQRKQYFDETLRQSEDIEFWTRFSLLTAWNIEGIPQALTYYRINNNGLSADIEKQLNSWETISEKLKKIDPLFVYKNYNQARAYQLRYLARRCVSMRDGKAAFKLILKAINTSVFAMLKEPLKTLSTLIASLLLIIANEQIYTAIENVAIDIKKRCFFAKNKSSSYPR